MKIKAGRESMNQRSPENQFTPPRPAIPGVKFDDAGEANERLRQGFVLQRTS